MIYLVLSEKRISLNSIVKLFLYGINIGVSSFACNVIYNLYILESKGRILEFMTKIFNTEMYSEAVLKTIIYILMILFVALVIGNISIVSRFSARDLEFRSANRRLMRSVGYNGKKRMAYEYMYVCADILFSLMVAVVIFGMIKLICQNVKEINMFFDITGDNVLGCIVQIVAVCLIYLVTSFFVTIRNMEI